MHMITFLFSAPVSRYISSFVVSYIHIAPALTPVCVEMTSYIIVRPVNVIIVQPMIGYMLSQIKKMSFPSLLTYSKSPVHSCNHCYDLGDQNT
jgi:hypothetical protein